MKILYEKYYKNERLENWTRIFESVDDMLEFMKERKEYLLGEKFYRVVITEITEIGE